MHQLQQMRRWWKCSPLQKKILTKKIQNEGGKFRGGNLAMVSKVGEAKIRRLKKWGNGGKRLKKHQKTRIEKINAKEMHLHAASPGWHLDGGHLGHLDAPLCEPLHRHLNVDVLRHVYHLLDQRPQALVRETWDRSSPPLNSHLYGQLFLGRTSWFTDICAQ